MRHTAVLSILALIVGCVTINVYFPAVAAEKAADRIIDDVWGPRNGAEAPEDAAQPQSASPRIGLALALLNWVIPPAAAAQPNIDISSPAIQNIVGAMEARHGQLKPYYASGAIGLTDEATLAVRDMAAVPLAQRTRVKQLVAEENADRKALYREIAVANGHPEWEPQIRATFAERWISKARPGWYFQGDSGEWRRK